MPIPRHFKRLALIAGATGALLASGLISLSQGDLNSQISAAQSTASSLQSQITADSSQISKTTNGVDAAKQRLATVQSQLNAHEAELRQVQTQLMESRQQLANLEARLKTATQDLAANLKATYENGNPNLVDVVLNSNGFTNLVQDVSFLKSIRSADAQIVTETQQARKRVLSETDRLGKLETRDQSLTSQIMAQRTKASALEIALLKQQNSELVARRSAKSKLDSVNAHLSGLKKKLAVEQAAAAAAAARRAKAELATEQATAESQTAETGSQVNQDVGGIAVNTGGMVQAPAGAPAAVREMIAAGNAIATLPYIWGGGHGSFTAAGYDCSGSVSYVLAAAGLLSAPEVSGNFESYGDAGPGKWVTIYANSGHVWMEIAGWRFDTVALSEDGSRWSQGGGEFGGFVVRHPSGL
jgi:peptidoglycan hydrolase CwlO-like protein